MSTQTFAPGDRVSDRANGSLGTVADDPAMRAEYPGMIPIHWDNGDRSVAAPTILALVADGIENIPEDEIIAELKRRRVGIPPAGFTLNAGTSEPGELIFEWSGPVHHAATWKIKSQWNDDEGLTYFIDHANDEPWTPAEVEAMTDALAEIKQAISTSTAVQYLRENHPRIDFMTMSINQVARLAKTAAVPASAMFSAWEILRSENEGSRK